MPPQFEDQYREMVIDPFFRKVAEEELEEQLNNHDE